MTHRQKRSNRRHRWLAIPSHEDPGDLESLPRPLSLIVREALRSGKVISNPARLVRQRHENDGRIRFFTDQEEFALRRVIVRRFPEHEAELTISLGTGLRLSEQYTLTWKNIDFTRREINLDRTKNGSPRMIPMNDAVVKAMEGTCDIAMATNAYKAYGISKAQADVALKSVEMAVASWRTEAQRFGIS